MAIFNVTVPTDTEAVKLGAQRIRELKTDLNTLLGTVFEDNGNPKVNTVGTDQIVALAVTTAKIANLAVTAAQLAADAVTTAKILDANVTTAKLADDSVTVDKIANDAVGTAQLIALSVTNDKIAAGTIADTKMAVPFTKFTESGITIPTSGTPSVRPHGLVTVPTVVQAFLVCTDAGGDRGYVQNQVVAISSFISNSSEAAAYAVAADATNIIVQPRDTAANPRIIDTDGDYNTITLSKWRLKVVAIK